MEKPANIPHKFKGYARAHLNGEIAFYVALAIIAFIMRMWQLGERAVHYDEGLHLGCGFNLFNPAAWCLEPWTHGPFQFIGTAANYAVLGDSEISGRLLPVLFGTAIVVLPYFLRKQLGKWGAIAAAVLLSISPLLMYYSRYARNDIYIAFFTLLLIVCIWNYIDSQKARWLYIGCASLSLSFCAKEITYINLAIILLFLFLVSARELASRIRQKVNLKGMSPQAELFILLGAVSLPLFAAFVNALPWVDLGRDMTSPWAKAIVIILFLVSTAIGLRWSPKRWVISFLIFYVIFAFTYSIFFQQNQGLAVGLWDNVAYWVGEHETARGGQPNYYYLMMIPLYEFLPVILATIALVYSSVTKNFITLALTLIAVAAILFFAFSAGMKDAEMRALRIVVCIASSCLVLFSIIPLAYRVGSLVSRKKTEPAPARRWYAPQSMLNRISVYSALLLLIAGGLILIYAFMVGNDSAGKLTSTLVLLCAAASMMLYVHFSMGKPFVRFLIYWAAMSLILYSFFGERMPWLSLHIVLPAIVLGGAFIGHLAKLVNKEQIRRWFGSGNPNVPARWVYSAGAFIGISALLFFTGYAAFVACRESYQSADDPPQLLMYAGVSADVPRIADSIKKLAAETGEGYALPVTVDTDIYYSGWSWYLRDYSVDTPGMSSITSVPRGSVLILRADHDPADRQYLEKYGEGERIRMLIWFPEDYKVGFSLSWWWGYFWGRDAGAPCLKTEGIVYFLKEAQ